MNTSTTTRPVRVYGSVATPKAGGLGGGYTYSREVLHELARFHMFGPESDETSDGPVHGISAVVELPDGSVMTFPAHMIQFLDAPAQGSDHAT